jgi:hypothetical protein
MKELAMYLLAVDESSLWSGLGHLLAAGIAGFLLRVAAVTGVVLAAMGAAWLLS